MKTLKDITLTREDYKKHEMDLAGITGDSIIEDRTCELTKILVRELAEEWNEHYEILRCRTKGIDDDPALPDERKLGYEQNAIINFIKHFFNLKELKR